MGVTLDFIPVEGYKIKKLREDITLYYKLLDEKSVWIRIFREYRVSPSQAVFEETTSYLLKSNNNLNLSYTLWKEWDVIHYLLCGTIEEIDCGPLSKVVLGGEKLYKIKKWSYSPPLLLSVEETKSVAIALANVSEAEINQRYKPEIIAELCYGVSPLDQNKDSFFQTIAHLKEKGFGHYWKLIQEVANYYLLSSEQSMGMIKSWG